MYFEAVKLLLSRFSDWENCDMYNYISKSSDWENCLTDAAFKKGVKINTFKMCVLYQALNVMAVSVHPSAISQLTILLDNEH